jgi:hypothetical protein
MVNFEHVYYHPLLFKLLPQINSNSLTVKYTLLASDIQVDALNQL